MKKMLFAILLLTGLGQNVFAAISEAKAGAIAASIKALILTLKKYETKEAVMAVENARQIACDIMQEFLFGKNDIFKIVGQVLPAKRKFTKKLSAAVQAFDEEINEALGCAVKEEEEEGEEA